MDITPVIPDGRQVIQSYGDGLIRISGTAWKQPILVTPLKTIPWDVASVDAITVESLQPLYDDEQGIELLLFGCGVRTLFIPPVLRNGIRDKGINTDLMDTGAACRTYNVLMAEDRRVAAALFPVGDLQE